MNKVDFKAKEKGFFEEEIALGKSPMDFKLIFLHTCLAKYDKNQLKKCSKYHLVSLLDEKQRPTFANLSTIFLLN